MSILCILNVNRPVFLIVIYPLVLSVHLPCSLNHTTIDAYLHVRLNMPVLADFDVRPAVRAWFGKQRRRAATGDDTDTSIKQEWYKGVFDGKYPCTVPV